MDNALFARKAAEKAVTEWTDEELVAVAKTADPEATRGILTRYHHFVRMKANSYFLAGGDGDDLIQEGYIGLYKAIRDFEPGRSTSFRSFAELCVTRQIITAIKTASRQKHLPLNTYVSFSHTPTSSEYDTRTLADVIPAGRTSDPAALESKVLKYYLEGNSYEIIAAHVGHDTKTVDNALQRIKRKVTLHLESRRVWL